MSNSFYNNNYNNIEGIHNLKEFEEQIGDFEPTELLTVVLKKNEIFVN